MLLTLLLAREGPGAGEVPEIVTCSPWLGRSTFFAVRNWLLAGFSAFAVASDWRPVPNTGNRCTVTVSSVPCRRLLAAGG